jgi:hypothetical protein
MKMIAALLENPSDTFHASMWSHDTVPAGKSGNTHVVPPKCQFFLAIEIYK